MDLDDHVCCCHHVSLRKLINYARRERPAHASKLSECLDAGTGCGWCIPVLRQIYEAVLSGQGCAADWRPAELRGTADEYAAGRNAYMQSGAKNQF